MGKDVQHACMQITWGGEEVTVKLKPMTLRVHTFCISLMCAHPDIAKAPIIAWPW